jgi:hypothetical protein
MNVMLAGRPSAFSTRQKRFMRMRTEGEHGTCYLKDILAEFSQVHLSQSQPKVHSQQRYNLKARRLWFISLSGQYDTLKLRLSNTDIFLIECVVAVPD